jgi:[ribosomal protein S18]-alanine N-acetyltransferase
MVEKEQMNIQPMSQKDAEKIATWKYDGLYSFYNADSDEEDLEELLSETLRGNHYFSVLNEEDELIGFFNFIKINNEVVIGLGLAPDLTGKGLGLEFVKTGINYVMCNYRNSNKIVLSVALFNRRAIKVYEKAGFVKVTTYMQKTNGSQYPFLKMEKQF